MNRIFLLFIAVVFSISTFAQKDSKAKAILDKSSNAYSQVGNMTVDFTVHIKDSGSKKTDSFDGRLLLKGDKLYLSTPDAETWFDGKIQWTYMKKNQEVTISEPSEKEIQSLNPTLIFNIYKKDCNYKLKSEKTDIKNRQVYEIDLIPQGKSDMTRIIVQINKADNMPVFFHILHKSKVENLIYINKYNTNQNHQDKIFVFDKTKYPDADINDIR